jgi:hypothetical protein
MATFTTTWYDQHTRAPISDDLSAHDAYAVSLCEVDGSHVVESEKGTALYAWCERGHQWQHTYSASVQAGAWIERP